MIRSGEERRFRRRRFLAGAAAGAAALALPAWLRPGGGPSLSDALAAASRTRFRRRLPIPEVLTGADLVIPIKRARIQLLPGRKTKMWTYGGTFPGPTVRRPAGETTRVTFQHQLGSKAGELTVHLHGGHNTSADDGQPGGLTEAQPRSFYCDISPGLSDRAAGNDLLISPGDDRTYTYEFSEDGAPERAAMHWYHDHRLDRTGENVWRGLAGMWITDDDFDSALPLPKGKRDIPLMITDRAFDKRNQLKDPFAGLVPPDDGAMGREIFVNGALLPHLNVSARRYRLRILNASNFRAYNLTLTKGARMVQIATEAGLMPAPLERDQILLGPAERAEVIVDFSEARGERVELRSRRREDGPDALGSNPYLGPVMEFRVADRRARDETEVPAELRALPDWTAGLDSTTVPSFTWSVTGGSFGQPWKINGKTYDPSYVERTAELGSVVVWKLANNTTVAHLMHLHHTDWYLLSRGGRPPEPHEDCLKETFFMDPGEQLVIAGKMSDYLGKYVIHCHMVDHEDHGLMSQFEVVEPAAPRGRG